jgi:TatD DNase family protein
MMIDTHAHLYQIAFQEDRSEMLQRAKDMQIGRIYLPAIDSESHQRLVDLANAYPDYCIPMMGLHPCSVDAGFEKELELVVQWLDKLPFAAIGEIGLDFYHSTEFRAEQYDAFEQQISIALRKDLPIVIHSRSSMDECIKVIQEKGEGKIRGIFHCFGGDARQARKVIEMGFYLGIGGVVTYKNAGLASIVQQISLEHLVLETDAPYLTPAPHRGKRNESAYLVHVADKIAELKGISRQEVEDVTTANAKKIFRF